MKPEEATTSWSSSLPHSSHYLLSPSAALLPAPAAPLSSVSSSVLLRLSALDLTAFRVPLGGVFQQSLSAAFCQRVVRLLREGEEGVWEASRRPSLSASLRSLALEAEWSGRTADAAFAFQCRAEMGGGGEDEEEEEEGGGLRCVEAAAFHLRSAQTAARRGDLHSAAQSAHTADQLLDLLSQRSAVVAQLRSLRAKEREAGEAEEGEGGGALPHLGGPSTDWTAALEVGNEGEDEVAHRSSPLRRPLTSPPFFLSLTVQAVQQWSGGRLLASPTHLVEDGPEEADSANSAALSAALPFPSSTASPSYSAAPSSLSRFTLAPPPPSPFLSSRQPSSPTPPSSALLLSCALHQLHCPRLARRAVHMAAAEEKHCPSGWAGLLSDWRADEASPLPRLPRDPLQAAFSCRWRGEVAMARQSWAAAITWFERSLEFFPSQCRSHFFLLIILQIRLDPISHQSTMPFLCSPPCLLLSACPLDASSLLRLRCCYVSQHKEQHERDQMTDGECKEETMALSAKQRIQWIDLALLQLHVSPAVRDSNLSGVFFSFVASQLSFIFPSPILAAAAAAGCLPSRLPLVPLDSPLPLPSIAALVECVSTDREAAVLCEVALSVDPTDQLTWRALEERRKRTRSGAGGQLEGCERTEEPERAEEPIIVVVKGISETAMVRCMNSARA